MTSLATRLRSLASGLAFVFLTGTALTAAPASAQQYQRLFYYVDRESSWESLQAHVGQIDVISTGGLYVDGEGVVWGDFDRLVLELAAEHDIRVMPHIQNPGFNQEMLHELLVSDDARALAIASMLELCRRHGFLGIQFDFENVAMPDRDALTRFYRETAEALHAEGYQLSAAVVHRPDELAGETRYQKWLFRNWRAGYDLEAMAEIGDFLTVMSYSQHTRRTPPGPGASIPWMRDVVEYYLQFMPPEKLSLGISVGSMHWFTSQEDRIQPEMALSYSRGLGHDWAMHLLERRGAELIWDDEAKVSYAYFPVAGTWEWVFVENARSFRAKLDLVEEYGLRGFSVWALGSEDPAVWDVLREWSR